MGDNLQLPNASGGVDGCRVLMKLIFYEEMYEIIILKIFILSLSRVLLEVTTSFYGLFWVAE